MPQRGILAVEGVRELLVATAHADRATKREVREALRSTGEAVREDAAGFMGRINSRTAAGFRIRVRQRGVAVAQSISKTTGKHPEYGSLQMRVLARAVVNHQDDTERALEHAIDRIAYQFERGHP